MCERKGGDLGDVLDYKDRQGGPVWFSQDAVNLINCMLPSGMALWFPCEISQLELLAQRMAEVRGGEAVSGGLEPGQSEMNQLSVEERDSGITAFGRLVQLARAAAALFL